MRSPLRTALVLLVALIGTSFFVSPAAGQRVADDVELGPATRYFWAPGVDPGFDPGTFGDSTGPGKGNGKDKDKGGGGSEEPSGGSGGEPSEPSDCWEWHPSEFGFLEKINDARVAHGRQRLRLDRELSRAARHHTWEMVQKGYLYHTPEDALRRRVTNWLILGENLGRGGSVDSLHQAFMESEPHRENVLYRPFNHVGIGTMRLDNGLLWVTILFEAYDDPGTTLYVPPMCN